jgi:hypothetical protein
MANCVTDIARGITANCAKPITGGYTGRGVLIPADKLGTVVQNGENPRIIESIEPTIVVEIDNTMISQPFNGSNKASSAENGKKQITKTFAVRIPLRGGEVSKSLIEPLLYSPTGFVAILEKTDKVGDGSFEVVGFQSALKVNDDGVVQNEYENGGDITATLSCVEDWYEVTLFETDYTTTLATFNGLLETAI